MPWYALHEAGHPNHADPGSDTEAVLVRLGYVEVPAPGSNEPNDSGVKQIDTGQQDTAEPLGHGGPVGVSFGESE